ncbi:hypothetical protein [Aliikangiella maris]|uniref:STAS/SEC14 domain-containing protein n=2 Tax=Aliikangiella maris TaxID=3162458 RepID=A0ABV3MQY2_9GAMM
MTSELLTNDLSYATLHFNRSGGFIDVIFHGGISLKLLYETFNQIVAHPNFQFNINVCYDFSRAYPEIGLTEISQVIHFLKHNQDLRGADYKQALVAQDTLNTALLSIYKAQMSQSPVDIEVFSKKTAAIRWLIEDLDRH